MSTFSITTPIYYVNDKPHIGHAYTTFVADALARWHRMVGDATFFVTGTDENSQKNSEAAAKKLGKAHGEITRAEIQGYVDAMSAVWQQTFDTLDITYDRFIRTTEDAHITGVNKLINAVRKNGDIVPGTYRGWYCVECEAFLPEKELDGGMCPFHTRAVEQIEEQNYFFKLSKYRDQLLAHYDAHPDFVQPVARRNEIIAYVRDHLEDVSISRPRKEWGIPFPGDPDHVVYVWFDALTNYMTAMGYGTDDAAYAARWPASVQLVGKDILKFHCALWPAMLMSAGLPLPQRVFAHGFFTIDGAKMSKSRGNVADPVLLAERYGIDALRYFLMREIPFGGDGDFSEDRLRLRYESDLQKGIGNLAARTLTMVGKYADSKVPATGSTPMHEVAWTAYTAAMDALLPHEALTAIWDCIRSADQYIEREQPWVLAKDPTKRDHLLTVLGNTSELLRHIALMLAPFLPDTANNILLALGQTDWRTQPLTDLQRWGITQGTPIANLPHLFPPLQ
ncbi:MAG: methionine--tRNA ligase [bacterium]|nr:methionine--tRNA ligase [bacterium]